MALHILIEVGGTLIVLLGLREVFRDIFHPTRSGSLSDFVGRSTSFLMRNTRLRPAVGPIALVATLLGWVIMLNLGFALIYCGLTSEQLMASAHPLHTGVMPSLLRGLYFSLGAFDTFQTFDLAPKTGWLRMVVAIEGLIGIAMITASVSWLVLLYPALSRMRQFAKRTSIMLETERRSGLSLVHATQGAALTELVQGIVRFRIDVILFPILLNFYASDPDATISFVLPEIQRLARRAADHEQRTEPSYFTGVQLQVALEELAHVLAERVVDEDPNDTSKVFEAFKRRDQS